MFQKPLFQQDSFSFQTKRNGNNNYEHTDSSMRTGKHFTDVAIDELFNTDKSLPSIVFFPSSCTKSKANS